MALSKTRYLLSIVFAVIAAGCQVESAPRVSSDQVSFAAGIYGCDPSLYSSNFEWSGSQCYWNFCVAYLDRGSNGKVESVPVAPWYCFGNPGFPYNRSNSVAYCEPSSCQPLTYRTQSGDCYLFFCSDGNTMHISALVPEKCYGLGPPPPGMPWQWARGCITSMPIATAPESDGLGSWRSP
jgi:hypothetical protein